MLEYLKDDKWHNLENGIEEELFKNKTAVQSTQRLVIFAYMKYLILYIYIYIYSACLYNAIQVIYAFEKGYF